MATKTRKTASESLDTSGAQESSVVSQQAEPTATADAEAQAPAEEGKIVVVILAYPGTEETMKAVWDKFHDGSHKVVTASSSLKEDLLETLKDDSIADRFIIVPANLIPCCNVRQVLGLRCVYVDRNGTKSNYSRLPLQVDKEKLVDILAGVDADITNEALAAKLNEGHRTMEVSFSFGNFITPVLRGTPCEHVVIEAFVRKFFVSASEVGFKAIEPLVKQFLLKG